MIANINLEDFLDIVLSNANSQSEKTGRIFTWGFEQEIKKVEGKKMYYKTIKLHTHDVNTGMRTLIVKHTLKLKNSVEALKFNWKKDLLQKLLYSSLTFYMINEGDRQMLLQQQEGEEEIKTVST